MDYLFDQSVRQMVFAFVENKIFYKDFLCATLI